MQTNHAIEQLEDRRLLSVSLTTLVAFAPTGPTEPYGGVMADAAGDLYGTTIQGPGGSGLGTVFELPARGRSVKTLALFNGFNGESPQSRPIADAAGNLYGTASFGGVAGFVPGRNDGFGEVFEVPADGKPLRILAAFNGSNGGWPQSTLIADAAGNLYGTTVDGGIGYNSSAELSGNGTVFKVSPISGQLTTLAFFDGSNGSHPTGALLADAAGNLYGTTADGGAYGDGTLFEITAAGSLKTLVSFNGANGSHPSSGLIADARGDLYGSTSAGGARGDGTVFVLPARGRSLMTLASFSGSDGNEPGGGLIADAAGNLYGTTWKGGAKGYGTVFKVPARGGGVVTLATFNGLNGNGPDGPLMADDAGDLYGTTWYGGPGFKPPYLGGDGTLFELTGAGFIVVKVSVSRLRAQSAVAGQAHAFALGSMVQAGAVGPFTDIINWGDGSRNTVVSLRGAGAIPATAHTYGNAGTFTISQTVIDAKGDSSIPATLQVAVSGAQHSSRRLPSGLQTARKTRSIHSAR